MPKTDIVDNLDSLRAGATRPSISRRQGLPTKVETRRHAKTCLCARTRHQAHAGWYTDIEMI